MTDPAAANLADPPPLLRPVWSTILAFVVALVVAALALGQLQGLLQGMHVSGKPATTMGDLNHLFHGGPDPKATASAVSVWTEFDQTTSGQTTASLNEVAAWAVWFDSLVFAPVLAIGLFLVFLRVRGQVARWMERGAPAHVSIRLAKSGFAPKGQEDELHTNFGVLRSIAGVGMALVVLGLIADVVENDTNLQIVDFALGRDPDFSSEEFSDLSWRLWIAGWAKWVFDLAAAGLALALCWVVFAESATSIRERWRAVKPQLHVTRMQLILVALVAVVPFGHEQISDLVRRWTPLQLAVSAGLVWLFAVTTWLISRRLLVHGQWWPRWSDERRTLVARTLFVVIVVLAGVQAGVHVLSGGHPYRPGWGFLVPASLLVALAILGWILPGRQEPTKLEEKKPLAADVRHPRLPRILAAFVLVMFGLGILHSSFGYSVYARSWNWNAGHLVLLGLVVGGGLVALVLGRDALVGAVAGGTAACVGLLVTEDEQLAPPVLVTTALFFVVTGWRLYWTLGSDALPQPRKAMSRRLVLALGLVFACCYAAIVAFPLDVGATFGGVGVLVFFALVATCTGALLVWISPAIPVPRALGVVGVTRFPILILALVWLLAASFFDGGGYHNVRLKDTQTPAAGVTLEDAFDCWLGKNRLAQNRCTSSQTARRATGPTPMIMVATTGGGIRAAYWTNLVLDCAFELRQAGSCSGRRRPGFGGSDSIFALSGISGGSLGLASYAAYLSEKASSGGDGAWVRDSVADDALSGSGAWWLFVEFPRAFLQFRSPTDRAGILERGWERQWENGELERGLLELWWTDPHQPLLLLNGTSVEDGCRFETSPLDANVSLRSGSAPGCKSTEPFDPPATSAGSGSAPHDVADRSVLPATRDLVGFLCGDKKDVRLSTAALLSGRFPFVNPSARVEGRCADYARAKPPVAYVVDGGYLDTSGASPIVEIMARLQPLVDTWNETNQRSGRCIVPLMVQIDNGFAAGSPRTPRRPGELIIPLTTVFATRGAREAEARIGAALLFAGKESGRSDRYAHFVNEAHPGPKAPLGWTQSRVSEEELESQLVQPKNKAAFGEVRRWLNGDAFECASTAPSAVAGVP